MGSRLGQGPRQEHAAICHSAHEQDDDIAVHLQAQGTCQGQTPINLQRSCPSRQPASHIDSQARSIHQSHPATGRPTAPTAAAAPDVAELVRAAVPDARAVPHQHRAAGHPEGGLAAQGHQEGGLSRAGRAHDGVHLAALKDARHALHEALAVPEHQLELRELRVACGMWRVGMWHVACGVWHAAWGHGSKVGGFAERGWDEVQGKRRTGGGTESLLLTAELLSHMDQYQMCVRRDLADSLGVEKRQLLHSRATSAPCARHLQRPASQPSCEIHQLGGQEAYWQGRKHTGHAG